MTFMWRKQLSKVTDLIVTLHFDEVVWPKANHEHLILFFLLQITDLGSYREPGSWLIVIGIYKRCERKRKAWETVVCAIFCLSGVTRGSSKGCGTEDFITWRQKKAFVDTSPIVLKI